MKKLTTAALLMGLVQVVSAQSLRIVNAASLSPVSVSPGSIVSIFGTQLNAGVAFASNVQNPSTTLGGVTVTIGGSAASLFYVSPTQINAVVNPATPAGSQTVTVTSATSGTHTGTVTIDANAAPGLFSLFGTGTRDGAILNAITFLLGDFSTRTANSPTYLALFATGLNPAVAPTVTIGGVSAQVVFWGAAPCCAGLQQINIMLPDSLAGAGRVPIVVTSGGQASNTVQVVLLPPPGSGPFSSDEPNQTRSRELSSLAYVSGTSLLLSADENDDVVRVIDVASKQVTRVITLPSGANPDGIAVDATGKIAAVAESGRGKVAILDLTTWTVKGEVATAGGPVAVAIAGTQAVVVNQDAGSVSIVDLTAGVLQKTLPVGHGPFAVAADASTHTAYVTNEDDGTISVVDLAGLTVARTITLGANMRPEAIALIGGTPVAYVALPAAGANGQVLVVNVTTGATLSTVAVNPANNGGTSAIVYFNSKLYFANQAGGSVSVLPFDPATGLPSGSPTTIKVDLGARAMTIDARDNLLIVSNEGSGTLVLIDLATGSIAGRINAVRSNSGDSEDDHSDRGKASNAPTLASLSPVSGKAGATVNLTITGTGLTGAGQLLFVDQSSMHGEGHGKGEEDHSAGNDIVASNIQVNAAGTQLTATVAIAANAQPGPRLVKVVTPNGETSGQMAVANTFTVMP